MTGREAGLRRDPCRSPARRPHASVLGPAAPGRDCPAVLLSSAPQLGRAAPRPARYQTPRATAAHVLYSAPTRSRDRRPPPAPASSAALPASCTGRAPPAASTTPPQLCSRSPTRPAPPATSGHLRRDRPNAPALPLPTRRTRPPPRRRSHLGRGQHRVAPQTPGSHQPEPLQKLPRRNSPPRGLAAGTRRRR